MKFDFLKKKKEPDLPPLPPIEPQSLEKDDESKSLKAKMELLLIKLENLETKQEMMNEKIKNIEKIVEELYKMAKS
jgi:chaperonin cofactor prefoldin